MVASKQVAVMMPTAIVGVWKLVQACLREGWKLVSIFCWGINVIALQDYIVVMMIDSVVAIDLVARWATVAAPVVQLGAIV